MTGTGETPQSMATRPDASGDTGGVATGSGAASVIQPADGRVLQVRKGNPRMPAKSIGMFFAVLAETCNVAEAARQAGLLKDSLYNRRRRQPGFAEQWRQALAIGYERLEEELLRRTLAALTGDEPSLFAPGEAGKPGTGLPTKAGGATDAQLALLLLSRHRGTVEGTARPNAHSRRATSEETDAYLTKQLDSLAKRLKSVAK